MEPFCYVSPGIYSSMQLTYAVVLYYLSLFLTCWTDNINHFQITQIVFYAICIICASFHGADLQEVFFKTIKNIWNRFTVNTIHLVYFRRRVKKKQKTYRTAFLTILFAWYIQYTVMYAVV